MTTKPWDMLALGYADAHTNVERLKPARVHYDSPRASVVCVGCLHSAISMDGLWYFKEMCIYCRPRDGHTRHVACPLFLKPPDPRYVTNSYYMYGYLRGVAAQSFMPLEFGGRA